ncbi:MAG: hypothetical protein AB1416_07660 [Actinomycetota bacterium]
MQAIPTPRRRARIALVAVPAALAALWAPSFVAEVYDGDGFAGTPARDYLTRPDQGWRFLADAVRQSRGTALGTAKDALTQARDVWAGPPAVADAVRLVSGDAPFPVTVPAAGATPAPRKRMVRPRSPFTWIVLGRVRGGPRQPIGALDYRSGRVVWDIRPLPGRGR